MLLTQGAQSRRSIVVLALLLIVAFPHRASAYVDPGSGAMIWQIAAAVVVGSLFQFRRAIARCHHWLSTRIPHLEGFLFAAAYALAVTVFLYGIWKTRPLPRFTDFFIVGIVLTVYWFRWVPAVFLLVISIAISAWFLPPYGTFQIANGSDWYRLISYSAVSLFLIGVVSRLKNRKVAEKEVVPTVAAPAAREASPQYDREIRSVAQGD